MHDLSVPAAPGRDRVFAGLVFPEPGHDHARGLVGYTGALTEVALSDAMLSPVLTREMIEAGTDRRLTLVRG